MKLMICACEYISQDSLTGFIQSSFQRRIEGIKLQPLFQNQGGLPESFQTCKYICGYSKHAHLTFDSVSS